MATLRQIKEKQNSISKINKITNAMKLVSSAKSQKAIMELNNYKEYHKKIEDIIYDINDETKSKKNLGKTYWILLLSDLGLAGSYNINVINELKDKLKKDDEILILGNKGISFFKKNKTRAEIFSSNELLEGNQLEELSTRIKTKFHDENKKVKLIYTKYNSQIDFFVKTKTILPIEQDKNLRDKKSDSIVEYEPNKEELLTHLESLYIHSLLVYSFKESQASEYTSRKNAMENATKNGEELLDKLKITFNRTRQAKITQEISEIIGGSESLR